MTVTSAVIPAPRAELLPAAAEPETATDDDEEPNVAPWLRVTMFTVAIAICLGVAGIGGWRSYSAVSAYFDSWTVPIIADGLVVGTTAIRLAALTRGWRVPGSMLLTIGALGGTVWLNVHASQGKPIDQFSHGIAPVAYLLLMEMLAYVLKLQLKLHVQAKARLTVIGWLVSPVVTTRTWLLMQRSGQQDPAVARVLIQQSIRARSQLLIICPSPWWAPIGAASRARAAALQTVRDGLLSAAQVVELLPEGRERMAPVELLMVINRRSLQLPGLPAVSFVDPDEDQADEEPEPEPEGGLPEPELELPEPAPTPEPELEPELIPELAERMERALATREARPPFHEVAIELGCSSEAFWAAVNAMGGWEETWDRLHPAKQQEQEQSSGRRRRTAPAVPRETKKSRFTARLLEVLADDMARTGTSRLLSADAEERNRAVYAVAAEVELDKGAARTYYTDAAAQLAETAQALRPAGLSLLPSPPPDPEDIDGAQHDEGTGGETAAG